MIGIAPDSTQGHRYAEYIKKMVPNVGEEWRLRILHASIFRPKMQPNRLLYAPCPAEIITLGDPITVKSDRGSTKLPEIARFGDSSWDNLGLPQSFRGFASVDCSVFFDDKEIVLSKARLRNSIWVPKSVDIAIDMPTAFNRWQERQLDLAATSL